MLLENTEIGKKYPFTFEGVGACDPETLALQIYEIKKNGLPVTRIVTFVGLDELIRKGWIEPMLDMAEMSGIRLIVPPISPFMELIDSKLEQRWNRTSEGAWLGASWNEETLCECGRLLEYFFDEYVDKISLGDCFGILVTDIAVLQMSMDFFTKVSVFCGTSNIFKALIASTNCASSISVLPMRTNQVGVIARSVNSVIDISIDPPRSFCPKWYELVKAISLIPGYIEAGVEVITAEGTENIGQLFDSKYLRLTAIPRQTFVFLKIMETLSTPPYRMVNE